MLAREAIDGGHFFIPMGIRTSSILAPLAFFILPERPMVGQALTERTLPYWGRDISSACLR